ncbi:MAG: AAA family ATPase [Ilumatobacteraceae bacterium]
MLHEPDPAYFDALLDDGPEVEADSWRDRWLTVGQIRAMPPPVPLVDGLLDLDSVVLMYGNRGSFKSFVGIDLGLSIAAGIDWHGCKVTQGVSMYVVAEGQGGLAPRFDAWVTARSQKDPDDFYSFPKPVNLLDPLQVVRLAEDARKAGARLVILDTLARCFVGGDENSARDAGMAVEQLDIIRRATGACVLLVHHSGKSAASGARGSSAFEAACDTVLEVVGEGDAVTITPTKQKNHELGRPIMLKAWKELDSIVLGAADPVSTMPTAVLATLRGLADVEVAGGVSAKVWRLSSDQPESSFFRHRKHLLTLGLVEQFGSGNQARYQVTDLGTLTLSEDSHA